MVTKQSRANFFAVVPGLIYSFLSCVLCTEQVSENKMFRLNESLEINTKKLCNLNESSDKSAKSLQVQLQRVQRVCNGVATLWGGLEDTKKTNSWITIQDLLPPFTSFFGERRWCGDSVRVT